MLSPNLTLAHTLNNGAATIDVSDNWTKLSDSVTAAAGGLYVCVWTVGSTSNRITTDGTEDYRLCLSWDTNAYEEAMLDIVDGLGSISPAGAANVKTKTFMSAIFAVPDGKNIFAWLWGGAADSAIDVTLQFYKVADLALAAAIAQPRKGVALANLTFTMTLDRVPVTGATVTATVRKDAGAFGAAANSVVEVGNGVYSLDLTASEMTANMVTLRLVAVGCDDLTITIPT